MKIYLLITILLVAQTLSYHYLNQKTLSLSTTPKSIQSLSSNVLVAQDTNTIYLYNTDTNYLQQTFISDSNNPTPQVANQLNMVLFKNNGTLFQMMPNDGQVTINQPQAGNEWVYPLGLANNTVVYHSLDPILIDRWINYVTINSDSTTTYTYQFTNPNENILRGSGVVCLSSNEYYFVSGGICNPTNQVLFFFRGDMNGINNVFNLSIIGCNMPNTTTKQIIKLSSVDEGNDDRKHAITYKLDVDNNPFMYTTQIVYAVNQQYQQWIRFDTFKLLGVDYVGSNLYTADQELCRVLRHYPDAYKKAENYRSVLPPTVTDTAISFDNLQLAVFNGTTGLSVYGFNSGTGKIESLLFNTTTQLSYTDGDYYGGNLWIARDTNSQLSSIYLQVTPTKTTADIQKQNYTVVDYCTTKSEVFYTVAKTGNTYTLYQNGYIFLVNSTTRLLSTTASLNLPAAVKSIQCLGTDTVLINPVNQADNIQTYQSNGSAFTRLGFIDKNNKLHNDIKVTNNAVIFTNANYQSMLVYDFRLSLITSTLKPILPPGASYKIITTSGSNIVFAIAGRGEIDQPDSLDHYTLTGSTLSYKGSYPLYGTNPVNYNKILLLGQIGRLSIDYGVQSMSFEVSYPPQLLRGHFYDKNDMDCRGYNFALFKSNPIPDVYDMLIINSINANPILQRYTFTEITTPLLTKTSSVNLNNYLFGEMQVQLSADYQKILIYGIKQTTTNQIIVQVKNANNLDTLFQKRFFDITSQDKVQAFGLYGSRFISAVTTKIFFINATFDVINLNLDIGSQGKVSTDSSINAIDLFATCSRCSFAAVSATNSKLIQLLSLSTGINRGNISVQCTLKQLAISADGGRIAYLCQNNGMYLYDDVIEQTYFLGGNYTKISQFQFLTNFDLIIINDGQIYHLNTGLKKNTSKLMNKIKIKHSSSTNAYVNSFAINNNLPIYAYITDPQKVQIYNIDGNLVGQFVFNSSTESIIGITFNPLNYLILTTDSNNLITLSPTACPDNSTINTDNGYCACNPTFANVDNTCMCASPLSLGGTECVCGDGNYFISESECGECNVMCHTCSGEGVSNCDSYSALFIILIIVAVLLVAGGFVFYYIRSRKGQTKLSQIQKSASNKRKSVSSDALAERLVENGGEQKMKLQI